MIYGYLRVSTEEQNLLNQKKAISEKFDVDVWFEEKKSGTLDYKKRCLGELIGTLQEDDVLVVTELSRLGRSLTMVFKIIEQLKDKKVRCVAIKNNFDMKPADNNDIVSSVLLFAFGLSAQIERHLISERTKQGLAVAKSKGKRVGKQKGEIPYYVKLRFHQEEIIKLRKEGKSVNYLAVKYGVKWSTMKRFLTKYIYMTPPPPLTECPRRHGHPSYRELEYFKTHSL